jgi:hypothetical protein
MVNSPTDGPGGASSDQEVTTRPPEGDGQAPDYGRLGVIHSGSRYAFGFGSDFYAIWDEYAPGSPVEQFPATPEGRLTGWERYESLEPSAKEVTLAEARVELAEVELRRARQRSGRRRLAIVGAVAAIAIIGFVVSRLGGGDEDGGGGSLNLANEAHVEVSGAYTITEDITLDTFTATGFEGLYPNVQATWTGTQVQLHMNFNTPQQGDNPTLFNPHRRLDLTLMLPDGSELKLNSVGGECTVTFDTLEAGGIEGRFACVDLPDPQGSEEAVDAEGTFSASG